MNASTRLGVMMSATESSTATSCAESEGAGAGFRITVIPLDFPRRIARIAVGIVDFFLVTIALPWTRTFPWA